MGRRFGFSDRGTLKGISVTKLADAGEVIQPLAIASLAASHPGRDPACDAAAKGGRERRLVVQDLDAVVDSIVANAAALRR